MSGDTKDENQNQKITDKDSLKQRHSHKDAPLTPKEINEAAAMVKDEPMIKKLLALFGAKVIRVTKK